MQRFGIKLSLKIPTVFDALFGFLEYAELEVHAFYRLRALRRVDTVHDAIRLTSQIDPKSTELQKFGTKFIF